MDREASFGRYLSARRHLLDLTQDELAQRVGCSVVTIRKIEADERRPSKQIAERLAASLGIAEVERAAFLALARSEPHAETTSMPLPARTSASRSHLPTPLTALIGREQDLAAIRNQLLRDDTRLLSLVGPPGIGKTRLSLAVAAEAQAAFADGAVFVPLAPISDPDLVMGTIAQTLGVKELGDQPLLTTLRDRLRDQQQLLILDNFEQVLAAAPAIAELLAACPYIKVLVTSRAALHIRGERLYPVPPLLLPDLAHLPATSELAQVPAVALFVERAQSAQPTFQLAETNATAVAQICTRLDGLPLAIELVGARVRLLPPAALLARLTDRLALLTDGPRDLPPRQQTLRSAIAWSYGLLDDEQLLFRRLGVFVGGCSVGAVEAVCNAGHDLPFDVLAGLAALLDHSLLQQDEGPDGEPRFTMLETIREYAREQLDRTGEAESVRRRHADYFLARAEQLEPEVWGAQQVGSLEQLQIEHDNLRVALRWVFDRGELETALRLAGALWRFWLLRGHFTEGSHWLEHILAMSQGATVAARVKVCTGAGWMAWHRGDYRQAAVFHEEALVTARALGDRRGMAIALRNLGVQAYEQGDYPPAVAWFTEGLALAREIGDKHAIAWALTGLGIVAEHQGEYVMGRALQEESLVLWREVGDKWGIALALVGLGHIALRQGDYAQATAHFEEGLALRREVGDKHRIANSILDLGHVALAQGNYVAARRRYEEGLALQREVGSTRGFACALAGLGHVALDQGDYTAADALYRESLALHQKLNIKHEMIECLEGLASVASTRPAVHAVELLEPERAAHLFGAAEALREVIGAPLPPSQHIDYEHKVAAARSQLDKATFAAAWAAGRTMTLEQAIAYALVNLHN